MHSPTTERGYIMSNRLFQTVIHQMKDVLGRTIGVIDENGIIIQASDKVKAADNPQQMLDLLQEL